MTVGFFTYPISPMQSLFANLPQNPLVGMKIYLK